MARRRETTAKNDNTDFSDIVDKITPVQDLGTIVTMVTYGRSGTGKTTFTSTWPKPILLLDVKDEGTDSIRDIEGVGVLSIETWDDFEKAYWFLKSGEHHFKSVAIDTVSQLQQKLLQQILDDEGKSFATQQIWGQVSGKLKTWIMDFRDLADDNLNINFIAQDRLNSTDTEEDEEQIDPEVGPQLMPSVASMLNAAVKVIGNTYIAEVAKRTSKGINREAEYRMRLGPHPYYITKIRKPKKAKCPDYITDPSFDKIIEIMKGNYGKTKSGDKPSSGTKKKKATRKRKS